MVLALHCLVLPSYFAGIANEEQGIEKTDDVLSGEVEKLSLHDSVSVSDEIGAELYIYCKTRARLDQLRGHVMSLMTVSDSTMSIFLDCEGHDLGRIGGKLRLVSRRKCIS